MDSTKREELEKAYRKERDSRVVLEMLAVHMVRVRKMSSNCSPHIIRQTINVSSIGRRLDTKLHEQMFN